MSPRTPTPPPIRPGGPFARIEASLAELHQKIDAIAAILSHDPTPPKEPVMFDATPPPPPPPPPPPADPPHADEGL